MKNDQYFIIMVFYIDKCLKIKFENILQTQNDCQKKMNLILIRFYYFYFCDKKTL